MFVHTATFYMKKLVLILLCCTLQALADDKPPSCPNYRFFEISVKNNTDSVCTIMQETLRRGYLEKTFFPTSIKPKEEKQIIIVRDYAFQGSDLVLSYQCGDDKFVTIESERDIWAEDQKYVKGWIWSAAGMDASYTTSYGSCETNQSGKIVWAFS